MSDPLSLIALGAAVGGIAGKVVENTWDAAERWLTTRFGEHSEAARARARQNAAAFVVEMAKSLHDLESGGELQAEIVVSEQEHPQFTATLQGAIIRAAQTDEREKHELLARLIAARLKAGNETIVALATQMACDAVALATSRQIRLLALCSFLEGVRPNSRVSEPWRWLDVALEPFTDLDFYEIDAMHLMALSCLAFDPMSEKSLTVLLCMKCHLDVVDDEGAFAQSVHLPWLEILWGQGLAGIQLTSVGSLVGALAFDRITGARTGLPDWDDA